MSKYENIRVIIDSIIESISGVTATVLLAFFFIVIFAIVGLNLFSGKFWSCQEEPSLTRLECEAAGLSWATVPVTPGEVLTLLVGCAGANGDGEQGMGGGGGAPAGRCS